MKFMNKKYSPLFGSMFGILPQCGFSIVATDLYNKRKVTVGALIAVYIATSDEALPIMISQPSSYKWILPLIAAKILIAIAIGFVHIVCIFRFMITPFSFPHYYCLYLLRRILGREILRSRWRLQSCPRLPISRRLLVPFPFEMV